MSDGTGNSSAKLFKTNVWRLYQSLDLVDAPAGDMVQVACYSDGVGTSSFRPLALLGGAFGWGLKRNILHLYEFLCRHWAEGDEIWLFGFSRGAFTVRTLAGMIATVGVLQGVNEEDLPYATRDAYRAYRATRADKNSKDPGAISEPLLVPPFRALRDAFLRRWRRVMGQTLFSERKLSPVERIRFVGVWETVAAYGTPFAEVTVGIDKFIFPLSMPTRDLNAKVEFGRQALGLDDERETFHPMPWNEQHVPVDRIKQVWFAGMHADVGGGYPDDALSVQPLIWMMREAQEKGLRYLPEALERFAPPPSRCAVMHDSRSGFSGYYRYQPRRLCAYLSPAERAPDTVLMIDPRLSAQARLREVLLHHSVVERMGDRQSRYAPTGLPRQFSVVDSAGAIVPSGETAAAQKARLAAQAESWDDIWRKRWVFRLTVVTVFVLASLPAWPLTGGVEACETPSCSLSPLLRMLGAVVPSFATVWTEAFANNPGTTVVLVGVLCGLLLRGAALERRVRDRMLGLTQAGSPGWVRWLRTGAPSVAAVKFWKWMVLPAFYGWLGLLLIAVGVVLAPGLTWFRYEVGRAEASGRSCDGPQSDLFSTSALCWPTQATVTAGKSYRVTLEVVEPWLDETIPAGPIGFENSAFSWPIGYLFTPAKRAINGRWFQPHVTIRGNGEASVQPLEFHDQGAVFVARFKAVRSGPVYLWVNDAVMPGFGRFGKYYDNNKGSAKVKIEELR